MSELVDVVVKMETVMKLSEMKPGQRGIVRQLLGEGGQGLRLMEMGLLPGTEIRFIRRAPLGDPLEVEIRGFHLSLRSGEAANIDISPV